MVLEKHSIPVAYTVTERGAYYRILFPQGVPSRMWFSVSKEGEISAPSPTAVGRVSLEHVEPPRSKWPL